jgi:hypothetical protein
MQLSTDISNSRGINYDFVQKVIDGELRMNAVDTYIKYESIYRIRHDSIHWLVCLNNGVDFGEKKVCEFKELSDIKHKFWDLVKNQTPDIIKINNKKIDIIEISVSQSKRMETQKISKYSLLQTVLHESGFKSDIKIIIIETNQNTLDFDKLNSYGFSEAQIIQIRSIIHNISKLLNELHHSDMGKSFQKEFLNMKSNVINLDVSNSQILDYFRNSSKKPFLNEDDLNDVLNKEESMDITQYDESFIDHLVNLADGMDSTLTKGQDDSVDSLIDYHKENYTSNDHRSIFPLPFIKSEVIDSSIRRTSTDDKEIRKFCASLVDSKDQFLAKFSSTKTCISDFRVNSSLRSLIALEGPGRKQYIKKNSQLHIDSSNKRSGYWTNFNTSHIAEIERVSFALSDVESGYDLKDVHSINGIGLNYIRCCQSIFREICINSLRREHSKNFIIKPTGVDGVFVIIHPGPKLRTGLNVSQIWFKLLINRESYQHNKDLSSSWVFKKWIFDVHTVHSEWLSTDANRLDHYLRCYDKVLMSYACYRHFNNNILSRSLSNDDSNTLGIITLIYMENKRSTSKMLQDVRYLFMLTVSAFKFWQDMLDKFKVPLRSSLQMYLLNQIINFVKTVDVDSLVKNIEFGKINVDPSSGKILDRFAGSKLDLPRILTKGSLINLNQMLCEMYFSMLFNKNQDDPTHSSFQILGKMVEGEESLRQVKEKSKLYMGYDKGDIQDLEYLINNPHKNQFSRRAIMIGSKLQSIHPANKLKAGLAHESSSNRESLNKSIDEFATFKSSSLTERLVFDPEAYVPTREELDQKKINNDKIKDEENWDPLHTADSIVVSNNSQNRRRRCCEAIIDYIKKGKNYSIDFLDTLFDDHFFQIFKKNQIGDVREILILPMDKRIQINILETFSRNICRYDEREMLTHGHKKNQMLHNIVRELRISDKKRIVMNYNFDKTRWGPSFMPIQFLYMFKPFQSIFPSLYRYICALLMNHTNKKCLYPERLIRAWIKDPDNTLKHRRDENLQKLKVKFLEDKRLYFDNESNMGQGILHYTSSYFHLCFISLRLEVYNRLCRKNNIDDAGEILELVSSDDSYTAQAIPVDNKNMSKLRMILFLKSQEAVERAMNIWTSKTKSSISALVYEFNSLFGCNFGLLPTTLKFALASVQPVNTDSFFRMVKESYNSCRQLVENGGSLELYLLASRMNKIYCESIYHVSEGLINSWDSFGVRSEFIPYQLGVYPISDPGLMIMKGPECHNYNIIVNWDKLTDREKKIFLSSHTLVDMTHQEVFSEAISLDNVFVGVRRIEAKIGPIRILDRIKSTIDLPWESIKDYIIKNPLFLISKPSNSKEIRIKIYLKLFQNSSAEALRTTASSLYYGRVSASVSANAFIVPYSGLGLMTYGECVEYLANSDIENNVQLIYPGVDEYLDLCDLSSTINEYVERDQFETQNLRTLTISSLGQKIKNPVYKVLEHFWILMKNNPLIETPNDILRDWESLKHFIPFLQPSIEETLSGFGGDDELKLRSLLLVLMRIISSVIKPMKIIAYGPSTTTFHETYSNLIQSNLYHSFLSISDRRELKPTKIRSNPDKVHFYYNIDYLSMKENQKSNLCSTLSQDDIENYMWDSKISSASKKKVLMMMMHQGLYDDMNDWSEITDIILHQWIKKQKHMLENDKWFGDFILKVQSGNYKLVIKYYDIDDRFEITINDVKNSFMIFRLLERVSQLINRQITDFTSKTQKGNFILSDQRILQVLKKIGFAMKLEEISEINQTFPKITLGEKFIVLKNEWEEEISKTPIGLLSSDYIPEEDEQLPRLMINKIDISKFYIYRIFSQSFDLSYLSNSFLLSTIDDLIVDKPKLTEITMKRLNLKSDWEIREQSEYIVMDTDAKYSDDDIESKAQSLFTMVLSMKDEIKDFDIFKSDSFHDMIFDPQVESDMRNLIAPKIEVFHPQIILQRIYSLKYFIIGRMICDLNIVNRITINSLRKLHPDDVYMTYSLLYLYDMTHTRLDMPTSTSIGIRFDDEFNKKFFSEIMDEEGIVGL